jgi:ABC-type multidrug transport system ATPase subunit
MENNLMIETRELTKAFGDLVAVDGIDLRVGEGSIHGFVGPNGAGKTTTIKMLVGAIRSTKGTGFIKGYPIGSVAARKVIGYSPEHPSFYGDMTALDYLIYMARVSGVERDGARKAAELLDWIELGRFVDTRVGGFSAGMKQRLSLAQALIHEPELLILDEPTANLDPTGRMTILDKLRQLSQERRVTIFISSHILSELEQLVDSVTLINRGQIAAEDSMEHLRKIFSQNHYLLRTSRNESVLEAMKTKAYLQESWLDADGFIHLISEDSTALKQGVMEAISQTRVLLEHFSQEEVTLESIYRRTMGLAKE